MFTAVLQRRDMGRVSLLETLSHMDVGMEPPWMGARRVSDNAKQFMSRCYCLHLKTFDYNRHESGVTIRYTPRTHPWGLTPASMREMVSDSNSQSIPPYNYATTVVAGCLFNMTNSRIIQLKIYIYGYHRVTCY